MARSERWSRKNLHPCHLPRPRKHHLTRTRPTLVLNVATQLAQTRSCRLIFRDCLLLLREEAPLSTSGGSGVQILKKLPLQFQMPELQNPMQMEKLCLGAAPQRTLQLQMPQLEAHLLWNLQTPTRQHTPTAIAKSNRSAIANDNTNATRAVRANETSLVGNNNYYSYVVLRTRLRYVYFFGQKVSCCKQQL